MSEKSENWPLWSPKAKLMSLKVLVDRQQFSGLHSHSPLRIRFTSANNMDHQPGYLTCAENAMIATVMASVAPIVMTTAVVLWKDAMAPTMYDKLRVTTTCRYKVNILHISSSISGKFFHSLPNKFTSLSAWKRVSLRQWSRLFIHINNYSLVYVWWVFVQYPEYLTTIEPVPI